MKSIQLLQGKFDASPGARISIDSIFFRADINSRRIKPHFGSSSSHRKKGIDRQRRIGMPTWAKRRLGQQRPNNRHQIQRIIEDPIRVKRGQKIKRKEMPLLAWMSIEFRGERTVKNER